MGDALASLKANTREAVAQNQPLSTPEYAVYPKPLKTEFDARRFAIGEDIYRVLGIVRAGSGTSINLELVIISEVFLRR